MYLRLKMKMKTEPTQIPLTHPNPVFEYVEGFYDRQRLHAAQDYQSLEQFEARQTGDSI